MAIPKLTANLAHELIVYDPLTGELAWKPRPRHISTGTVRSHMRSTRRAYDPAVHDEIRVNLHIERELEEDLAQFVKEMG